MKSHLCCALIGLALVRPAAATDHPTFSGDVARIIFENCTPCHRPGQAAPFSLTTHEDVRRRGRQIGEVVGDRFMPPWKADEGDYVFRHDRRLSDAQIRLVLDWIAAGMPEGDPVNLPPLPAFPDQWPLGEPDLILQMPAAFEVPAEGRDIYRNFVLPLALPEEKWIRAIDFRPGAKSVVHHSLFYFDATGSARELDGKDGQPGYSNRMGPQRSNRVEPSFAGDNAEDAQFGGLGGWALGGNARELPDGLAMRLPKGADFILSTHFHPSGKAEAEISTVALYFADGPPEKQHTGIQLPPLFGALSGLDIPPGESEYVLEDTFTLPVGVQAFGVSAHAHYLARTMRMTATFPDGTVKVLAGIGDWDFAWQE
ncbi:MAG TPA: hypothetical protein DCY13_06535, partial [Verrucomicrobiales bacterium]|nr:hypothetical protein [Verrucomicrobiales bacterium]